MRILITNYTLSTRTGTETYVRDLALGLLAKGHSPIVYSPRGGAIAGELRALTIPVVDDLANISVSVDVIHGHHRHETMTALLHFPNVPAIFFVHDWHSLHDLPPTFPRILRYVAIDGTRRDRLVLENGVPESRVTLMPNGVDVERFRPRSQLPERPQRGLVFSNYVSHAIEVKQLRDSCTKLGMSLDVIGAGMHRSVTQPERVLHRYDLVFAMGRSALEAMAVGTGVVVWGLEGLGGFVHSGNFSHLQETNFGRRSLRQASTAEIEAEIRRFDRREAQAVHNHVRSKLSQQYLVEKHLELYQQVIDEFASHPVQATDQASELRMAAYYLKACQPIVPDVGQKTMESQRRKRQFKRLIDIAWASLTMFAIAFGVRVETLALVEKAYGLAIGSLPICLLLCFGLYTLRRQLRRDASA